MTNIFEAFQFKKKDKVVPETTKKEVAPTEETVENKLEELRFENKDIKILNFPSDTQAKECIAEKLNDLKLKERVSPYNIELVGAEDTGKVEHGDRGEWTRTIIYKPTYEGRPIQNCKVECFQSIQEIAGKTTQDVQWRVKRSI